VLVHVVLIVMDGLFHNSNCAGALVNRDRTSTVCPEGFSNTRSIVNHILLTSCDALAEHSIYIIVYLNSPLLELWQSLVYLCVFGDVRFFDAESSISSVCLLCTVTSPYF